MHRDGPEPTFMPVSWQSAVASRTDLDDMPDPSRSYKLPDGTILDS
jgi:hypothetical protein